MVLGVGYFVEGRVYWIMWVVGDCCGCWEGGFEGERGVGGVVDLELNWGGGCLGCCCVLVGWGRGEGGGWGLGGRVSGVVFVGEGWGGGLGVWL
uniref:Uncharacterized protein n=1 Tax=Knipowitschia caucasica TaxID=637954 RepID=A0AAV2LUJ8_KNICA